MVYTHVKQGNGRYARTEFAFEYQNGDKKIGRAVKIYYSFTFYEKKNRPVGADVAGQIDNIDPRELQMNVDL
jgi:hypothetical protein